MASIFCSSSSLPQIAQLNALISLLIGHLTPGDRMKIMTICTIDVHARDVVAKMILAKVFITRRYFCDARHSLLGILAPLSTDFLLFYHFAIFSQYPDSMSKAHMGCQGAWGELGWWRHDWGRRDQAGAHAKPAPEAALPVPATTLSMGLCTGTWRDDPHPPQRCTGTCLHPLLMHRGGEWSWCVRESSAGWDRLPRRWRARRSSCGSRSSGTAGTTG